MESVNNETSIIIKKTNDLEAALRDLQEHFKEAYHELQVNTFKTKWIQQ